MILTEGKFTMHSRLPVPPHNVQRYCDIALSSHLSVVSGFIAVSVYI